MIPDKKYEEIERFANSEMTEKERNLFEQEIAQNDELAQVVALYQDMPEQLHNIKADLDFNRKLQTARNNYVGNSSKSTSWKWLIIGLVSAVIIGGLIWKQFFTTVESIGVEETIEQQQSLPEGVPIASLWKNTEMPPAYITRSGETVEADIKTYQNAHQIYSQKNYAEALAKLNTISETSIIHGEVLLLKGVIQYELSLYDEAIQTYDEYLGLKVEPQDMVLWYQALACVQAKQIEKAKSNLQIIIDNDYSKAEIAKELLKTL